MKRWAELAATLAVACSAACASMVPARSTLTLPTASPRWLAGFSVNLEVEGARNILSRPGGDELATQLKGVFASALEQAGARLTPASTNLVVVRVERYDVREYARLDPTAFSVFAGCAGLTVELRVDPPQVLGAAERCFEETAPSRAQARSRLFAAYEAVLGEVLAAFAQSPDGDVLALLRSRAAESEAAVASGSARPAGKPTSKSEPKPVAKAKAKPPATAAAAPDPLGALRGKKLLVLDLRANGVDTRVAKLLTTLLLSRLDQVDQVRAMGAADVNAVLTADRQKSLLGCDSASCMAEIGGAIGAEIVIHGEVGRLGSQYTLSLTALSTTASTPLARLSELTPTDEDALSRMLPTITDRLLARVSERLKTP